MKLITDIHDLVMALGGYSSVARWAGYEDARGVHNWITRGIPPGYHLRITLAAARRGLVIDPSVLGLASPDDESVFRAVFDRAASELRPNV